MKHPLGRRGLSAWLVFFFFKYASITVRGGGRYLRLGGHQWWCVRKYTHARGSGGMVPQFFKTRSSEIASEAIFVLKSGQFLPWTCLALCDKIAQWSLNHHCTYAVQFKRGQKSHDTRQFEGGGALKGKFLPSRGTCPWCPPGSAAYDSGRSNPVEEIGFAEFSWI